MRLRNLFCVVDVGVGIVLGFLRGIGIGIDIDIGLVIGRLPSLGGQRCVLEGVSFDGRLL